MEPTVLFLFQFGLQIYSVSLIGSVLSNPLVLVESRNYLAYDSNEDPNQPLNYDESSLISENGVRVNDFYNKYTTVDDEEQEFDDFSAVGPETSFDFEASKNPQVLFSLLPASLSKRAPEFNELDQLSTSEPGSGQQLPQGLGNAAPLIAGLTASGTGVEMNPIPAANSNINSHPTPSNPAKSKSNSTSTNNQKPDIENVGNEGESMPGGGGGSLPGGGTWQMLSKGLLVFSAVSGVAQIGMIVYVSEKKLKKILGAIEKVDDKIEKKAKTTPPPQFPLMQNMPYVAPITPSGHMFEIDLRSNPQLKQAPPDPIVQQEPPKPVVEPEPESPNQTEPKPEQPERPEPEPPKQPEPEPEPVVEPEPPKPPEPEPPEKVKNPVLGNYDRIEVKESSVNHNDRNDIPIEWINPFAFYFKWDDTNHQIWVYNIKRFCLYQICNFVPLDFLNVPVKRLSPGIPVTETKADRILGCFGGYTIHENKIEVNGKAQIITWINSKMFFCPSNHEVWIYNTEAKGYLQLSPDNKTCIKDAHALAANVFHRLDEKVENIVIGSYDRIEVKEFSVNHNGRNDIPIEWINPLAFYFEWNDTNHQIWVYDTTSFGLRQMCNIVPLDLMSKLDKKKSSIVKPGPMFRVLGRFAGHTISQNNIEVNGETRTITWINPLAFHFEFSPQNHQVWIYNIKARGYLQLLSERNTIKDAHALSDKVFHKLD